MLAKIEELQQGTNVGAHCRYSPAFITICPSLFCFVLLLKASLDALSSTYPLERTALEQQLREVEKTHQEDKARWEEDTAQTLEQKDQVD